ncbi:hypothetical protein H072_3875 [Dactylellina haptotyla CBS 200.50]|uniref:Extracellular membrane protein CFEM domain-containing protein n=1 Tax=Dactylellina haptotyla (strain CBS 200.50) TaxID=1284197 RepID=S8C350_DACHA|nr:hypothetical protein H072_3875 [Dactylellina haptotyla CBS 200.50]
MQHTTQFLVLAILSFLYQTSTAQNNSAVDFSTAPRCARPSCLEDASSPYTWTTPNLCPNSNSTDVTYDCFCAVSPRPLLCQTYDPASNDDACFLSLMQWYTSTCNSAGYSSPQKTLNFLQLPNSSRPCAKMMASHLGCPDNSLNCACQLQYLASNTAACISSTSKKDIKTYIGDLTIFATKWINQACAFPLTGLATTEAYRKSPAAYPQEVLAYDFQGPEYTGWQNGLDNKRARASSLGVIISLSLVFGGIFGMIGLQWILQQCGCTSRQSPTIRRMNAATGRGCARFGGPVAWVWKGFALGLVVITRFLANVGRWILARK